MENRRGQPETPAQSGAFIVTRRLILRPPEIADIPAIARLCNDKTIARWVGTVRYPYSALEGWKFVRRTIARRSERKEASEFLITLRSNPRIVIGSMSLSESGDGHVLGYWMARPYRRRGFVTEAARALIARAVASGATAIRADFLVGNDPSRRVMERLGLRRVGVAHHRSLFLRRKALVIRYRLTAPRWRGSETETAPEGAAAEPE